MKNPLRKIYCFFKTFYYCKYWKNCQYFANDARCCTKDCGLYCGQKRWKDKHPGERDT